jgi:hypothetical protein
LRRKNQISTVWDNREQRLSRFCNAFEFVFDPPTASGPA